MRWNTRVTTNAKDEKEAGKASDDNEEREVGEVGSWEDIGQQRSSTPEDESRAAVKAKDEKEGISTMRNEE
ncbi:hypothetical protein PUN28_015443 [Cardiocondyla obscurior]|uniref:Uncharacterized protein n=1 Tax=Cardiocondyla obscurior TaxID=286306 RepID=A0AAW2EVG0_9HYME